MLRNKNQEFAELHKDQDCSIQLLGGLHQNGGQNTIPVLNLFTAAITTLFTKIHSAQMREWFHEVYALINAAKPVNRETIKDLLEIVKSSHQSNAVGFGIFGRTEERILSFEQKLNYAPPTYNCSPAFVLGWKPDVPFEEAAKEINDEMILQNISGVELFGSDVVVGIIPGIHHLPFEYGEQLHRVVHIDHYPLKPVAIEEDIVVRAEHIAGKPGEFNESICTSLKIVGRKPDPSQWVRQQVIFSMYRMSQGSDQPFLSAHFELSYDRGDGYRLHGNPQLSIPNGYGHELRGMFQQFSGRGNGLSPDEVNLNANLVDMDLTLPNRRKLSPHIVVFNNVEKVLHPGTNNMIPGSELRSLLWTALKEAGYYEKNEEVFSKYPMMSDHEIERLLDEACKYVYPKTWFDNENVVGMIHSLDLRFPQGNRYDSKKFEVAYSLRRAQSEFDIQFEMKGYMDGNTKLPNFTITITYDMAYTPEYGHSVKAVTYDGEDWSNKMHVVHTQRSKSYLAMLVSDMVKKYVEGMNPVVPNGN